MRRLALALALGVASQALAERAPSTAEDAPPAAAAAAAPLAPRPNIRRIAHEPGDESPSIGPTTAPVTVDLFIVPGAALTKQPFDAFRKLAAAHPSRIRLVFRIVSRGSALLAPLAAAHAHAEGRFFAYMEIQNKRSNLRRDEILEVARQAGVDAARLEAAWDDGRHQDLVDANESRRQRLHADSVPAAVFNGERVDRPLGNLSFEELEGYYERAYDRALDALDRGVPRAHLAEAFDRAAMRRHDGVEIAPGPIDDPDPTVPLDAPPALLTAPLDTSGWPAVGDADAPVTVAVLCNLRTVACQKQVTEHALKVLGYFPHEVRVVWAPMFDPASSEATSATLINDAALCAEELGAGWGWVEQATQLTKRRHGRPGDPDKEIDDVIAQTELDPAAVARCLATSAGASVRTVARLRAAGVKSGPSIVVGGRVYPGGVSDYRMLQALVEDELAPGILEDLVPDWRD